MKELLLSLVLMQWKKVTLLNLVSLKSDRKNMIEQDRYLNLA